jgi:hypothetical protein
MVRVLSGQLLAFCSMLLAQAPKLPDISYDPQAPLDLRQSPVKDLGYAKLLDISYASPRGGRVTAYAVIPAAATHPAGIVWQHWGQGDRSSMLPEAISMSRRGAASILINSPANRPDPPQAKTPEEGFALWLQDAVDIRRAADALVQNFGVPETQLAYVGHSYGATLGGVIAVGFITEEQANRYAKAASTPKLVRWYDCGHEFNDAPSTADREDWLAQQLSLSGK